eukprot:TRINITY_DN1902_c0_g1_i1.p1 TRINITY_DN1902_c0_g1~~TRINITY_DN1902_c0_g1_i1.p1  ORF type:complete len:333 (-),score=56.25 TRINITY_DN1902_c0_g1_i1:306-1304(-)
MRRRQKFHHIKNHNTPKMFKLFKKKSKKKSIQNQIQPTVTPTRTQTRNVPTPAVRGRVVNEKKACHVCGDVVDEDLFGYHVEKCTEMREGDVREEEVVCKLCDGDIKNRFVLDGCGHMFCNLCLQEYIRTQVVVSIDTHCPYPSCEEVLSARDMKLFLPDREERKNITKTTGSIQGTQRIVSELTNILNSDTNQNGYSVEPIDDNLYHWEVRFFGFEDSGLFADDMNRMGVDYILFHVTFPQSYPFAPPYLRVIRPRFKYLTGHVTIGGSVCMELLTNKGWSPENTIESVLISVRLQLLEGGARLDFNNKSDYSIQEAKVAFDRLVRVHGWY